MSTESISAALASSAERRPSILMVDDDGLMLGVQVRMLQAMGYGSISTATSADAALQQLESTTLPDVVFCDLNMPGMDGIEFLQRSNSRGYRFGVVLLSGEGLRVMHTVQRLLGSDGVLILGALEKPAGRQALRAVLDCWQPATPPPPKARPDIGPADLQRALENSQWMLHFQPKVDLRNGTVAGVEALVRMNHPRLGLVGPDYFIAMAEEAGSIDALTDWVLRAALEQLSSWQAKGLDLSMAINLSMDSLRVPGFAAKVSKEVARCRVSPHDVVLELTESRLISPLPAPLENLARLRMRRFELSIDDFGTGHSSLAQLRDVPFTELKIDRSFVRGARHSQISRPILEGSLVLAAKLGMRSVAEGVETEDDWMLLRELGCDLCQGWFVGQPMAAEQLPDWLHAWRSKFSRLSGSQNT